MIRILYLISDLETGIGASLVSTVRQLAGRFEFQIAEFFPEQPEEPARNKMAVRSTGTRVVEIGKRGVDVTVARDLLRIARVFRPHIVQGFQIETNFYAWLVAQRTGARAVANFHGLVSSFRLAVRPFLYAILHGADRLACVSQAAADLCVHQVAGAARKVAVIPNGVALEDFPARESLRPQRAPLRVISVADFYSEVKGQDYLLQAEAMFDSHETELWLVGGGRRLQEMEALAGSLGVSGRVRFWGRRHDVARLLEESDVFVLPSLTESCPHALLEAMAVGLPVVATDVGGVSEIVTDHVTGLLVPPANPGAIRDAVRALGQDRALCERIATNGANHVRRSYSAEAAAQSFAELYESLAADA